MKLVSLVLTFILSTQLVYANATVCENYGKCSQMVSSEKSAMKDCPMHAQKNQNNSNKDKKKSNETKCKCCALLIIETALNIMPTTQSAIDFIDFQFLESSSNSEPSFFLRPPIA